MENFRFNYIITIHNKQDLIRRVLEGVLLCAGKNSFIYPVLDGCTDGTEKIIDEIILENPGAAIKKIYAPDVHEIKAVNIGLRAADQKEKGFNIIMQDDVILEEPDLESIVAKIYNYLGYSKVGYLTFRHGVNMYLKHSSQTAEERDLVESVFGTGMSPMPLGPHKILERMVTVCSPQCISSEVVNTIGLMDEALAPATYSCHDISLRCLEAGLHNYVFALKFRSEIEWGGMRTNPKPEYAGMMERNRKYIYKKHLRFLENFFKSKNYFRLKTSRPFLIPGVSQPPETQNYINSYYARRKRSAGLKTHYISKFIKLPLKKALIYSGLY